MIVKSVIIIGFLFCFGGSLALDENETESDTFVTIGYERYDDFDWYLTKKYLLSKSSNLIVSPFSNKILLSILTEATLPKNLKINELSHLFPSLNTTNRTQEHTILANIFDQLLNKSDKYEINLGTKIFIDKSMNISKDFTNLIQRKYFTNIEKVNFQNIPSTINSINKWSREITKNRVTTLIKEDDLKALSKNSILLINAPYFNAYWWKEFIIESNPLPFYVNSSTTIQTTFMKQCASYYYIDSIEMDAKLLRIPYKGGKFSMLIILPNSPNSLGETIRQIRKSVVHRMQWLMDKIDICITLPKFRLDHFSVLDDAVKQTGIVKIFEAADSDLVNFSGASVFKVLQKIVIEFNEKGSNQDTQSTDESIKSKTVNNKNQSDNLEEIIIDRPFMFLIEDEKSGTILYAGKVLSPNLL